MIVHSFAIGSSCAEGNDICHWRWHVHYSGSTHPISNFGNICDDVLIVCLIFFNLSTIALSIIIVPFYAHRATIEGSAVPMIASSAKPAQIGSRSGKKCYYLVYYFRECEQHIWWEIQRAPWRCDGRMVIGSEGSPRVWLQLVRSLRDGGRSDILLWLAFIVFVSWGVCCIKFALGWEGLCTNSSENNASRVTSSLWRNLGGMKIAPKRAHYTRTSIEEGGGRGKLWAHWLQFLDWIDGLMANPKM